MENIAEFLALINPETIIKEGGLVLLLVIIFAETGLFFGFFLPGDALLFIAGLLVSTGYLAVGVIPLVLLLIIAAILGNIVGYYFGRKIGPKFFERKDSRAYRRKYLVMTQDFYNRHSKTAIIFGRFLPILRTFVPIFAGVINLHPARFMLYNVVGAAIWVPTFVLSGYWLGQVDWVRQHLELFAIPLFIFTVLPIVRTIIRHNRKIKGSGIDKNISNTDT